MRRPHPERPGPESCPPIPDGPWPPVKRRPYAPRASRDRHSVEGERKRPSGSGREGRSASPRQVSGMSHGPSGVHQGRGTPERQPSTLRARCWARTQVTQIGQSVGRGRTPARASPRFPLVLSWDRL